MEGLINWLLEGEPYIVYRTRRDLLGQSDDHPELITARKGMLSDRRIQDLIRILNGWPWATVSNHKSANLPHHILNFICDIGLKLDDPGIKPVANRILTHISSEGVIQSFINIPKAFGGSGEDGWHWMLCDAPLVLRGLICLGLGDDPRIQKGVDHLTSLVRDNGWPCAADSELGKFHGPGRRDDACPYATLIMLKLLVEIPELHGSSLVKTGWTSLLQNWDQRKEKHSYLFYMGDDFCKLKAPLFWYDILHVIEVLSHIPECWMDVRFKEMVTIMAGKAKGDGKYTPESIWTYWKDWEFGQKKIPSRWISLLIERINRRAHVN